MVAISLSRAVASSPAQWSQMQSLPLVILIDAHHEQGRTVPMSYTELGHVIMMIGVSVHI